MRYHAPSQAQPRPVSSAPEAVACHSDPCASKVPSAMRPSSPSQYQEPRSLTQRASAAWGEPSNQYHAPSKLFHPLAAHGSPFLVHVRCGDDSDGTRA